MSELIKNAIEVRTVATDFKIELREVAADGTEQPARAVISGYGAVYDTDSTGLYFIERIVRGAFDRANLDGCICLFNHDENIILGSRRGGSLALTIDDHGLKYDCTPHDTQLIRDQVLTPMRAGDLRNSSFRFTVDEDEWNYDYETDIVTRNIISIGEVLDVSPVLFPAYEAADSSVRNAKETKESRNKIDLIRDDVRLRDEFFYNLYR